MQHGPGSAPCRRPRGRAFGCEGGAVYATSWRAGAGGALPGQRGRGIWGLGTEGRGGAWTEVSLPRGRAGEWPGRGLPGQGGVANKERQRSGGEAAREGRGGSRMAWVAGGVGVDLEQQVAQARLLRRVELRRGPGRALHAAPEAPRRREPHPRVRPLRRRRRQLARRILRRREEARRHGACQHRVVPRHQHLAPGPTCRASEARPGRPGAGGERKTAGRLRTPCAAGSGGRGTAGSEGRGRVVPASWSGRQGP